MICNVSRKHLMMLKENASEHIPRNWLKAKGMPYDLTVKSTV